MMEETITGNSLQNKCPDCGSENAVGLLVCGTCGAMLKGDQPETKKLKVADVEEIVQHQVDGTPRKTMFPNDGVITLRIRERESVLRYDFVRKSKLVIGRRDKQHGNAPDIDFYDLAGYVLGVSRRHALLHLIENEIFVEDVGSSNGTSVDGERLAPYERKRLYSGAEVRMGQLRFTVHF